MYRCVGSLYRDIRDCERPVAGALVCFGYVSDDRALEVIVGEEPRPLLFPACSRHRPALLEWAEHLWGAIAEGIWVEPDAIPFVLADMAGERVVLNPDPHAAVGVEVG